MKASPLKLLAVLALASPLLLAGCHSDEHPGEGAEGGEHPEQSAGAANEHPEKAAEKAGEEASEHPK